MKLCSTGFVELHIVISTINYTLEKAAAHQGCCWYLQRRFGEPSHFTNCWNESLNSEKSSNIPAEQSAGFGVLRRGTQEYEEC